MSELRVGIGTCPWCEDLVDFTDPTKWFMGRVYHLACWDIFQTEVKP